MSTMKTIDMIYLMNLWRIGKYLIKSRLYNSFRFRITQFIQNNHFSEYNRMYTSYLFLVNWYGISSKNIIYMYVTMYSVHSLGINV